MTRPASIYLKQAVLHHSQRLFFVQFADPRTGEVDMIFSNRPSVVLRILQREMQRGFYAGMRRCPPTFSFIPPKESESMAATTITVQDQQEILSNLLSGVDRLLDIGVIISGVPTNELSDHHNTWLDLYQIGDNIKHLAERLDSVYQSQSTPAPEDRPAPTEPLYCWNCGHDTGETRTDDNQRALCPACEMQQVC